MRDILRHRFTTVTEARSFNSDSVERSTQFVHDQHRLRFAFDVFRDQNERFALLYDFSGSAGSLACWLLFIGDQDVWILKNSFHFIRIGNHVWRDVAAVELHTFYNFQLRQEAAGFFNGDDAVFAHFIHRFCNQLTNFIVADTEAT